MASAASPLFRHAVFGHNTTIVVGSGSIHGVRNSVVVNDVESLVESLRKHEVSEPDLNALRQAIDADKDAPEHAKKSLGPQVRSWIGAMVAKAGTAGWQVSIEAAGSLLACAIAAYYGFGA